uniref:PPM-type phosphatase domain-containing protein n=1 Tax=Globisporangium ultimum (strain ATCC 200006 / CBS 805.95 / DAOM BR144) TaxID=431595 RepID=K3WKP7_GLOUD
MGNFLTSPITDKDTLTGAGNNLVFGFSAMQGWRTSMEDSHIAQIKPRGFPDDVSIFAVFDGHGGRLTAAAAEELMIEHIASTFEKRSFFKAKQPTPKEIGAALTAAFLELDATIRMYPEVQMGSDQSGCTAIVAYVTKEHIIVANAGDSRSVLGKNGNTTPMSFDHKPMNESERNRIDKAGGMVRGNRVNGDLAVSRALGDYTYKQRPDLRAEEQQVSAEPDITIEKLDGTEEFLVIACDGIWDVMTNDGICEFVRNLMKSGEKNLGLIAEEILDDCLAQGSRDNMSAIVVQFPGAKFGTGEGVEGIRKKRQLDQEAEDARESALDEQQQ